MSPAPALRQQLADGAPDLAPDQLQRLTAFGQLLERWNQAYNLISTRTVADIATTHILDSLLFAPLIPTSASRILDVGCGSGLPGLPLAITHPDISFTLLDRSRKKTRFVRQVVLELELPNVEVVTMDVADYRAPPFDCILARAVASMTKLVPLCDPLCAPHGQMLFGKGPHSMDQAPSGWEAQLQQDTGRMIVQLHRTPQTPN